MRVVVLMSTYRGEQYVEEQIASILAQLPAEGRLIIRDDGSPDGTVERIRRISDSRVSLTRGANIGFVRSFLALLAGCPADAEMVMLSDQDDVWLPDKVQRAWQVLGAASRPTLYCSRLQLVDAQLRPIGLSPLWPREPSFQNALTQNVVTGCTAALNRAALELFREHGDPASICFHDWWLYLVVSAFGRVVFDPQPTILYRQHQGNAIGMGSGLSYLLHILHPKRRRDWIRLMFLQIDNLRAVHGERLPPDRARLLDSAFNPRDWRSIARLLFLPRRVRQTLASDVLLRLIVGYRILTGWRLAPQAARR